MRSNILISPTLDSRFNFTWHLDVSDILDLDGLILPCSYIFVPAFSVETYALFPADPSNTEVPGR